MIHQDEHTDQWENKKGGCRQHHESLNTLPSYETREVYCDYCLNLLLYVNENDKSVVTEQ